MSDSSDWPTKPSAVYKGGARHVLVDGELVEFRIAIKPDGTEVLQGRPMFTQEDVTLLQGIHDYLPRVEDQERAASLAQRIESVAAPGDAP